MKWTNSCDALVDFVEEHGGSMGGETRDHLFNIVQNIVDGQSVLETPPPDWNQPFPDECKHYNLPENCHWCKEESTASVEPVPAPHLEHVLELRDDGWSLEHPQVCRESKSLLDCPVHSVVKSHEDEMELWEHGRFNVGLDEYGELEKLSSAPPVGPQPKEN